MGNEGLIKDSLITSFIDKTYFSNDDFQSKLLVNNYKKGTKVLSHIIRELKISDEFYFSVAFVTYSGINLLLNTLKELEENGIKGKIVTTNYLNFNEPKALRKLLEFKNIEVKVFDNGNFHSKGYIFKNKNTYKLMVGSSNLTQEALTKNEEWNVLLTSAENGSLINQTLSEFDGIWNEATVLTEEWISIYEKNYKKNNSFIWKTIEYFDPGVIKPNKMQKHAMSNIQSLRDKGETKALLISATGTGKTYMSAFDVKQFNPKRMLFIIHREQIAKEALDSYKRIFGNTKTMGILSGNSKDKDCDFIFSTIQTLSKEDILYSFNRDNFDYIVFDEVHHIGAKSYREVLEYFQPKFLLGMTATPERTDGINIYKEFDHNIAYEIRLQQALEEDMLCPFHYFGVSEIEVDGSLLDEDADFRKLTCDERVRNIVKQANFYSCSGERTKGLIFCSNTEEAKELSNKLNKYFRTVALTGESSQESREECIIRLQQDDNENALDYIVTVDIFNEGVDIPKVNQIIMLRPTQSAIVYVQQLGRGLRKDKEKDFVVIIDFIGNYKKNFLIPIALSGDKTYNKDNVRKYVIEGTNTIPGCSSIMFDKITEKKIFDNIDKSTISDLKLIKEEYKSLSNKLGKIPTLVDFYDYGSVDPQVIFEKSDNYYTFLKNKMKAELLYELTETQLKSLTYLSQEVSNTKRPQEMILLNELIKEEYTSIEYIDSLMRSKYGIENKEAIYSAVSLLNNRFLSEQQRQKYNVVSFVNQEGDILKKGPTIKEVDNKYFMNMVQDLVNYSIKNYDDNYINPDEMGFVLYKKYSRKDVSRILNWPNLESILYGYRIRDGKLPIFVNYKKDESINVATQYEDKFVTRDIFSWMTRHGIRLDSDDAQQIINSKANGLKIMLFVKKQNGEGSDFYYCGLADYIEGSARQTLTKDKKDIVNVRLKLRNSVKEDIYDYVTSED